MLFLLVTPNQEHFPCMSKCFTNYHYIGGYIDIKFRQFLFSRKNERVFTRFLFVQNVVLVANLNLPAFENKKIYTASDRFHGKGPYGEIPTKKEPIKRSDLPQATLPCNKYILINQARGRALKNSYREYEVSKKETEGRYSPSTFRESLAGQTVITRLRLLPENWPCSIIWDGAGSNTQRITD